MKSQLIDARREKVSLLSIRLIIFGKRIKSSQIESKGHVLSAIMEMNHLTDKERAERVSRELQAISELVKKLSPQEFAKLKAYLQESLIDIEEDIPALIQAWNSFSLLKKRIADLAELSLVFPSDKKEFHLRRSVLRDYCRRLMLEQDTTFNHVEILVILVERMLELASDEYPELLKEYSDSLELIYCEALVSCS